MLIWADSPNTPNVLWPPHRLPMIAVKKHRGKYLTHQCILHLPYHTSHQEASPPRLAPPLRIGLHWERLAIFKNRDPTLNIGKSGKLPTTHWGRYHYHPILQIQSSLGLSGLSTITQLVRGRADSHPDPVSASPGTWAPAPFGFGSPPRPTRA